MPTPNPALRAIRQARGLSLSDLASKAGVSIATVSRIETGTRGSTPETLAALAAALDVEVALITTKPERVAS